MDGHITEAMIAGEAADCVAAPTDEDVQGYGDIMAPILGIMGKVGGGFGFPLVPLPPTHTATPVTSGGSSGGTLGEPKSLN